MAALHQIVALLLAARDESKRDDLALGEEGERALAHGELVAGCLNFAWLAEIGAQQAPRLDFERIGFAFGLKAFSGREIGERPEVVFGALEAGIGRGALPGEQDPGVDGVSGGLGRALENRQQNFALTGAVSRLHLFGAIHPAVGNLIAECESGVAVKLGVL